MNQVAKEFILCEDLGLKINLGTFRKLIINGYCRIRLLGQSYTVSLRSQNLLIRNIFFQNNNL